MIISYKIGFSKPDTERELDLIENPKKKPIPRFSFAERQNESKIIREK